MIYTQRLIHQLFYPSTNLMSNDLAVAQVLPILHIHSLHQFATVIPSHDPLRRHAIIMTIFRGFGTYCPFRLRLCT